MPSIKLSLYKFHYFWFQLEPGVLALIWLVLIVLSFLMHPGILVMILKLFVEYIDMVKTNHVTSIGKFIKVLDFTEKKILATFFLNFYFDEIFSG